MIARISLFSGLAAAQSPGDDFFETRIRPLLADHCVRCHGPEKQSGGLRLDQSAALLKGGDGGRILVAGEPDSSRVVQAVRYDGELQMPPDGKLSDQQILWLTAWIAEGAKWPETSGSVEAGGDATGTDHWAFQPIRAVSLPRDPELSGSGTPVDQFIQERLRAAGLRGTPEADRRTLIRRLFYKVTGLPPTPEDVAAFERDTGADAWEKLVDRLLHSPAYGEQWARHWLDVARYSDTKGYVYAREERFWTHAWAYRDWVVNALNADMPYDRFLLLQIAADQVPDRNEADLAAMGFLTTGRRFLGVQRDIIDDRIDVVTRGTMALTVGCARCHDHKYDPIPTADYYSLYGVFASCREQLIPLVSDRTGDPEYQQVLSERQQKLEEALQTHRATTAARVRSGIRDYLFAQTELHRYPEEGFDQILGPDDILPSFVRRWEAYLREADRRKDPVFVAWHRYAGLTAEGFSGAAVGVTEELQGVDHATLNPLVRAAFGSSPTSFSDVVDRYAELFRETESQWQAVLQQGQASGGPPPDRLPVATQEQLRAVLYGPGAPCEVPDEPVVHTESDFESSVCTDLWKLQGEVDRWILNARHEPVFALTLADRTHPSQPRIFRRGNPATKGDEVPRRFLSLFQRAMSESRRAPFQHGSGRLEMAQAIIDPANPLTARVIVNRVWAHHFGNPLVTSIGDFGTRSDPPSHPELLDWLAADFVANGWSLKHLHRRMLLSAAFRRSSTVPQDPKHAAGLDLAMQTDPTNRLLWKMNAHRLSFEEMRDSMLSVSGDLDPRLGGKPVDLFTADYPVRRTLYGLIDRQFLPGTLRVFDFANPDLHIPQRSETTVPQQALFLINHPLVLERARSLARAVSHRNDPATAVRRLFEIAYQRLPEPDQLADAVRLIAADDGTIRQSAPVPPPAWSYGSGRVDESAGRVLEFQPLPHFTGSAWQGGANWPDPTLGWVQLTAAGGHAGNDHAHAAVRRWTAPGPLIVTIRSELNHAAAAGDGIRAFTVSSGSGILNSAKVHRQTVDLSVPALSVAAGDTIDFVVDLGDGPESDEFTWRCEIRTVAASAPPAPVKTWDSAADFSGVTPVPLSPLEQLAHVILCSNEFLFVD